MKNFKIIIVLLWFFHIGCRYPPFEIVKTELTKPTFDTFGYYASEKQYKSLFTCSDSLFFESMGFVFFNNGLLYNEAMICVDDNELVERWKKLNNSFQDKRFESYDGWGVFHVNNDTINYEYWYAGGDYEKTSGIFKIINDSTLYRIDNTFDAESYYRFYRTSIKPDSTNKWIK